MSDDDILTENSRRIKLKTRRCSSIHEACSQQQLNDELRSIKFFSYLMKKNWLEGNQIFCYSRTDKMHRKCRENN